MNAKGPMVVSPDPKVMLVNEIFSRKAFEPIVVSPFPITIEVKPDAAKLLFPIEVTLLGRLILVRLVVRLKAKFPIVVTPSLNDTLDKEVAPSNAEPPIDVTVEGIKRVVIADTFLNALLAIAVTPSGIATAPEQLVFPVTTLLEIVKAPPPPQLTVPSARALADGIGNVIEIAKENAAASIIFIVVNPLFCTYAVRAELESSNWAHAHRIVHRTVLSVI
jgi:hypothetical protein